MSVTTWAPADRIRGWLLAPMLALGLECCAAGVECEELANLFTSQPLLILPILRCCRVAWDDEDVPVGRQGDSF